MQETIKNALLQEDQSRPRKYQFKTVPWKHQRTALELSWNKTYFALLCDYGTGKTKIVIDNAGILFTQNKIDALFIVAPNEVHERWVSEQIPQHLPDDIPRICRAWEPSDTQKFKRSLEDFWDKKNEHRLKVFSINVEALQASKKAQSFARNFLSSFITLLVIDESTRIKNPSAKRTKFIIDKLSPLAHYRRTLTGNEITRSPFDVYSPYMFLKKDFWGSIPSFQVFQHRYGEFKTAFTYRKSTKVSLVCPHCRRHIGRVNIKRMEGRTFASCELCSHFIKEGLPWNVRKLLENEGKFEFPTLIRYKNLDELRQITRQHSFIIKKEDCMDLPPKVYQPLYATMNSEQTRLYKELKKNMVTEYDGIELSVPNKIALSVRFQQIVGGFFPETGKQIGDTNPKLDRLMYDLEDIDCGDPIIIWSRFTSELDAIAETLRKNYDREVALFYGATDKPERRKILDRFQGGEIGFFVANPQTAGTGLNLQRGYIHYYYSNSFIAEDRWQSEDRSHRGEQKNTCLYKDILIKGTIDDTIKKSNDEKRSLAEYFREKPMEELV